MDIRLKDFDDYSSPKRRPWLVILVILAVVGIAFGIRAGCRGEEGGESNGLKLKKAPSATESTAPAAASPVAASTAKSVKPQQAVKSTPATKPSSGRTTGAREPGTANKDMELLNEARLREDRGDFLTARQLYLDIVERYPGGRARGEAESRLGMVNIAILFSTVPSPEKVTYQVKPGDRVEAIAKKFGTTPELVCRGNQLPSPNLIRLGDDLRVFNGKMSVVVSKSALSLVVYMNGHFFKRYSVSVGEMDKTPIGKFTVTLKQENPTWYKRSGEAIPFGDPRNLLGTRWMAIKDVVEPKMDRRGLGIHGTNDDSTIGKAVSAGCIRMHNSDVEELYCLLPLSTPVQIVE